LTSLAATALTSLAATALTSLAATRLHGRRPAQRKERDWYLIAVQPAPAPHSARPEGRSAPTHIWQTPGHTAAPCTGSPRPGRRLRRERRERDCFIDNPLVRIHFIIETISVDRPCAMGV
jgi:hypothetical protein